MLCQRPQGRITGRVGYEDKREDGVSTRMRVRVSALGE